jgi:hypothetical protein
LGIVTDVAATFYTTDVADADRRGRLVLEGLAESMSQRASWASRSSR